MEAEFTPQYFGKRRLEVSQFVVSSCISAFSTQFTYPTALLLYDTKIVQQVLSEHADIFPMEFLSMCFDFVNVMNFPSSADNYAIAIRKLFAYGYFAQQLYKGGQTSFLATIPDLLNTVYQNALLPSYDSTVACVAFGYILSSLAPIIHDVDIIAPENRVFFQIASITMKFLGAMSSIPEQSLELFSQFILNSLFAFPIHGAYSADALALAESVLRASTVSVTHLSHANFNYIGLTTRLLQALKRYDTPGPFSLNTRANIFCLIASIARADNAVTPYIMEFDIMPTVIDFLVEIVESEELLSLEESKEYKKFNAPPNDPQTPIFIDSTFSAPIPLLSPSQRSSPRPTPPQPQLFAQSPFSPRTSTILAALNAICSSSTFQPPSLTHMKTMKEFLQRYNTNLPTSAMLFSIVWSKYVFLSDINSAIEYSQAFGFFSYLMQSAFATSRTPSIIHFACDLFPFIASKNPTDCKFLRFVLQVFETGLLSFNIDTELITCINQCIRVNPSLFSAMLSSVQYDRNFSSLLVNLKLMHYSASKKGDIELIKAIENTRLCFLNVIDNLLSTEQHKELLFNSPDFVDSLVEMTFEKYACDFAIYHIFSAICYLNSTSLTLVQIFEFIKTQFAKAKDGNYSKLAKDLFGAIVQAAPCNTSSLAFIFLKMGFFDVLIEYTKTSPDSTFALLEIFRIFSTVKGDVRQYISDADLFSKLFALLQPSFAQSSDQSILSKLWSIVFEDNDGMSRARRIENASPLSLIFDILQLRETEFVAFIQFISDCCEVEFLSALEINQSSFPGHLLGFLSKYRKSQELDSKFEPNLNLLSVLSAHSMKGRDLNFLFQALSSLPGNFRPFFGLEIIKSLLFIFQPPFDDPAALIHLNGQNTMIANVQIPNDSANFREFSFFVDLCIISNTSPSTMFYLEMNDCTMVRMFFQNQKLFFEIRFKSTTVKGSFGYSFVLNTWTNTVVTYGSSKLTLFVHGKEQESLEVGSFSIKGSVKNVFALQNLECCVGSFGLFSRVLDPKTISLFAAFPRTGVTGFRYSESSEFPSEFCDLFSGDLINSAVFLYSPAMTSQDLLLNVSQYSPIAPMTQVVGEVFPYSPRAKDAMYRIGGLSAVLPLFAQMDQPLPPKEGAPVEYRFDENYLPFLLQVIIVALRGSTSNQENFAEINGFSVLAFLLSRAKLTHLNEQSFVFFKRLFNEIEFPELAKQMIEDIFLNIRLWIYLPEDTQVKAISMLNEIFDSLSQARKLWFTEVVPFKRILYLMRATLWNSFTDSSVCLLDQPKFDPITKTVEGLRPKDTVKIRNCLWILAQGIASVRLTPTDAETLCLLSFDLVDMSLSIEILTMLTLLLRRKNEVLINALKSSYTFLSFFPILISGNDRLRSQCVHIFVLFQELPFEDSSMLLAPYQTEEWVHGIVTTINTENTTTIFADVVFGYLFGFFDMRDPSLIPKIRISKLHQPIPKQGFKYLCLLPLAILSICDFPADVASQYLTVLYQVMYDNYPSITVMLKKDQTFEHPFIQFLMHRLPNDGHAVDEACQICLNILVLIYMLDSSGGSLTRLPMITALFSARTKNDYSHILRLIYSKFIDQAIIAGMRGIGLTREDYYNAFKDIFEFIFFIPDNDPYYSPTFTQIERPAPVPVTYQELHRIKFFGEPPSISFAFGTRTDPDYTWKDAELAHHFVYAMSRSQEFLCYTPPEGIHPMTMFAYVISTGLQHKDTYAKFASFIQILMNLLPPTNLAQPHKEAFACIFCGLAKFTSTAPDTHQCISILHTVTQFFNSYIFSEFQMQTYINQPISAFKSYIFSERPNFSQPIFESFKDVERLFEKRASHLTKTLGKELVSQAKVSEKYATHFRDLNVFDCTTSLNERMQQIRYQLLEFGFTLRNSHSEGGKRYRAMWKMLSSERGPWCPPDVPAVHRWKLDKTMQNSFKRGRLSECFNFNDHKDASILRDVGNLADAQAKYNEHLKAMKMTEFAGDQSVVTMGTDVDEKPEVDQKSYDVILKADAKLVTMKKTYGGTLLMTRQYLLFEGTGETPKFVRVQLDRIRRIYHRKYLMMDNAIEIFTSENQSYFLDFVEGQRAEVIKRITRLKISNIEFIQMSEDDIIPLVNAATQKWQNGTMSTFDYLIQLNIYAGRSYNDLSQYPVFPWVLADYRSEKLDLSKRETFRDFSRPIGTLSKDRLDVMKERMGPANSPETHYLYSSFYSSSAVVIGYLIRLEPFTSLHIELQSGRFDHADRLFNSIPRAWDSVKNAPMDFRELIPEFFYFPDFLKNLNGFDLGKGPLSNGDVELPTWAPTFQDFTRINREALESEYVSQHINEWIDLIFGYTSRGDEAEKVDNLFNPNFFATAMTKKVREDPAQLSFLQEFALCFGQAPSQLFNLPHPRRSGEKPQFSFQNSSVATLVNTNSSVISIEYSNQNLTIVNLDYEVVTYKFSAELLSIKEQSTKKLNILAPVELNLAFKVSHSVHLRDGYCIFANPFDSSFEIDSLNPTQRTLHTKRLHTSKVSSITGSKHYYVTGSDDCTVVVWNFEPKSQQIPAYILSKHRSPITCVAISEENDIVVSCSMDGSVVISTLIQGRFVRTTEFGDMGAPNQAIVLPSGTILVAFSKINSTSVCSFDSNMNLLKKRGFPCNVDCWSSVSLPDGSESIVVGLSTKQIVVIDGRNLETVYSDSSIPSRVVTMLPVEGSEVVVLGLEKGGLMALRLPIE